MSTALEDLLRRHVEAGTVPGAVGLLDREGPETVAVGLAAVGGPPLRVDALMRIQSMTMNRTGVSGDLSV